MFNDIQRRLVIEESDSPWASPCHFRLINERETRNKMLPGPMHLLQTLYFWFRRLCETADRIHGREERLPLDSRSGGRFRNI